MDGFDSRISPRSSDVCKNPEEPEGEDEDVQMERVRTENALNSTNFDEVKNLQSSYFVKQHKCLSVKVVCLQVSFSNDLEFLQFIQMRITTFSR